MIVEPLSEKVISDVTREFLNVPGCSAKLAWWLQDGHACERWLQFEWAYLLQNALRQRYVVACEVDRVDIVCYPEPFDPLAGWKTDPGAAIEVKFDGTWWF